MDDDFNKIDKAWNIYTNIQSVIQFADKKVHILLAISLALLSFVLTRISNFLERGGLEILLLVFFIMAAFSFGFFALSALFARSDKKSDASVPKVIYFGHIKKRKNPAEYTNDFLNVSADDFLNDICHQIYELSAIAERKFKNYRLSWTSLVFQILFFIILIVKDSI